MPANEKHLLWSARALSEYDKLFEYLYETWGEEIAMRITTQLDEKTIKIQNKPYHYPVYFKKKDIRRCVFSPQTSIFFRIKNDLIEIVSIFDNRQNPKKRKL